MVYKHFTERPPRLTAEFVGAEYQRLIARIDEAERSESPEKWLELFSEWNALGSYLASEGSRTRHAYSKDMNDAAREEADRYLREEISPVAADSETRLVNALLASRHRGAIEEKFGAQLIRRLETEVEPLDPINSELRVRAGSVAKQYAKLVASGEVEVGGQRVTLAMAGSLQASDDPAIRREAFEKHREWFRERREEIAAIFGELVALRHQMALNLGHENFIRLGYFGMGRTDYGPEEVARFRESIRTYAVPVQKQLLERQARELGTPTLKPWDSGYDPQLTPPRGIVPIDTQLERAQRVFDALSPDLGRHFSRMCSEDLIDLENRHGKRPGAYCTNFPDEGRAAILCNSTGDAGDVRTLMHEMGHAFQKWESAEIEPINLQWPTADVAEIHSMGMEYLSMRHMDEFFDGDNLARFRRGRWKRAITLLCYMAVGDEFQHWVYENPDVSFDDRDAAWNRIWDRYKQGIDYSGMEEYKALNWYGIPHFFASPFYFVDYGIAETGAMQLALLDAEDHERAMEIYMTLCRKGGTEPLLDVFKSVGMRSPFDPDLMHALMDHAAKELRIEN
jgi:M3 family oligoendopeptidase